MYPELQKYKGIEDKKNLQIINLGTGMGYYDFCYDDILIPAFNFSLPQQTLQFDYKLLKHYCQNCESGCKVFIVLPYCIFCANHFEELDYVYERYYSILPAEEVEGHCVNSYEKYMQKIIDDEIGGRLELTKALGSYDMEKQSQEAIQTWERQLPIISCQSGELNAQAIAEITETKNWLAKILELCSLKQLIPVIVVPPMSRTLLEKLSPGFKEAYFYNPLHDVIDTETIILDYTENELYCNPDLYGWPGFLVKNAAKKFTKDVLVRLDII